MFKIIVRSRLERYVKKYFKHHHPKLIVVVGSVGKTVTKHTIAAALRSAGYSVRIAEGNYNADMSVPLVLLGVDFPENGVHSIKAWLDVFAKMRAAIKNDQEPDFIVQELGTDHPGEIPHFGEYLRPDLAVVTAITPEHMEYFGNMDAVANEELSVADYSKEVVVNMDDIAPSYMQDSFITYSLNTKADYTFEVTEKMPLKGYSGHFKARGSSPIEVKVPVSGEPQLKAMLAAAAVLARFDASEKQISDSFTKFKAVPGRMQILDGKNDTTLIDDTYNSSPAATASALRSLYDTEAPQRIAVLGSMNELGETSQEEHEKLGKLCDPKKLDLVVTVGEEAKKYLAPATKEQGCKVKSFLNPKLAGEYVEEKAIKSAVILYKGSQNGVFAEEALKCMLKDSSDAKKLVRQSKLWMNKKQELLKKSK
jgi:UDP-N-acetylmuramoyl-tripeptide--D-alanyl-D-alanine ligase